MHESHGSGAPRVGLLGRLGSGNIGNDATLEAALAYLRTQQPEAFLDCMCAGPTEVTRRYGLPAIQIHWFHESRPARSRLVRKAMTTVRIGIGLVIDTWRTASWVRQHDVVIIPGMGVLEAAPLEHPWQLPYSMFLLSVFGKIFGTKVALVCVGVTDQSPGLSHRLLTVAAKHAYYRSFRDDFSLAAAQRLGIAGPKDRVYPDLVFALPTPPRSVGSGNTVGLGVMAHDGVADGRTADERQSAYVDNLKTFVRWLVDTDHQVRILIGDDADESIAREIVAAFCTIRNGSAAPSVVYEPTATPDELFKQIVMLDSVVATRFHNVLVALKCSVPTLSIGYGPKHRALMEYLGFGTLTQDVDELDVDRLKEQFRMLEANKDEVAKQLSTRTQTIRDTLESQFAELSAALFPKVSTAGRGKVRRPD